MARNSLGEGDSIAYPHMWRRRDFCSRPTLHNTN